MGLHGRHVDFQTLRSLRVPELLPPPRTKWRPVARSTLATGTAHTAVARSDRCSSALSWRWASLGCSPASRFSTARRTSLASASAALTTLDRWTRGGGLESPVSTVCRTAPAWWPEASARVTQSSCMPPVPSPVACACQPTAALVPRQHSWSSTVLLRPSARTTRPTARSARGPESATPTSRWSWEASTATFASGVHVRAASALTHPIIIIAASSRSLRSAVGAPTTHPTARHGRLRAAAPRR